MSKVRLRDISVREMTSRDACQEIEKNLNANNVLKQINTINLSHFNSVLLIISCPSGPWFTIILSNIIWFQTKRVLKIYYLMPAHCGPYMVMTTAYLVT